MILTSRWSSWYKHYVDEDPIYMIERQVYSYIIMGCYWWRPLTIISDIVRSCRLLTVFHGTLRRFWLNYVTMIPFYFEIVIIKHCGLLQWSWFSLLFLEKHEDFSFRTRSEHLEAVDFPYYFQHCRTGPWLNAVVDDDTVEHTLD